MEINELIRKSLETLTVIKEIDHPVSEWEIERLKTLNDVLLHSASILSDVQEMLTHSYTPNEINPEINEAKFFIFKAIQYLDLNPLCPFKDLCPIYKKAKTIPLLMRR
jgi:hypothetical protein